MAYQIHNERVNDVGESFDEDDNSRINPISLEEWNR